MSATPITGAVFGLVGLLLGATTETWIYAVSVFDIIFTILWYWFNLIGWTTIYSPYYISWYFGISWAFSIAGNCIMGYAMDENPFIRYDTADRQKYIMLGYFLSFILTIFLYVHYYASPHGIWLPIVLSLVVVIIFTCIAMFFYVATVITWLSIPGLDIKKLRGAHKYSPVGDWNEKDARYKWYVLGGMLVLFIVTQFWALLPSLAVTTAGFSTGDLWTQLIALGFQTLLGFILFFWFPVHK